MNPLAVILVVLLILALTGGFAGWYPHAYGFGGGGLLLLILVILLLAGRL